MEVVGACLGDDVDHCAGGAAIVGGKGTGIDLDFLNAVDRGPNAVKALGALVVVEAVNHLVIRAARLIPTARGDLDSERGAPVILIVAVLSVDDSWLNLNGGLKAASVQGQIGDRGLFHRAGDFRRVGLHHGGCRCDIDGLGHRSGLELRVKARAYSGRKRKVRRVEGLEADLFHCDRVGTAGQLIEDVLALSAGGGCACFRRARVLDAHLGVGNHGACGVGHGSQHVACGNLRMQPAGAGAQPHQQHGCDG